MNTTVSTLVPRKLPLSLAIFLIAICSCKNANDSVNRERGQTIIVCTFPTNDDALLLAIHNDLRLASIPSCISGSRVYSVAVGIGDAERARKILAAKEYGRQLTFMPVISPATSRSRSVESQPPVDPVPTQRPSPPPDQKSPPPAPNDP